MTYQIKDTIIVDGQKFKLRTYPLTSYIRKHQIVINDDPLDIVTCCWRGYTAGWEIRDDKLWLTGLVGMTTQYDIVPRFSFASDFPVLADWVSEEVVFYPQDSLFAVSCTVINGNLIRNC